MTNLKYQAFAQAISRLHEILGAPETDFNRDAAIQRFEFTVELAWKCIQARLREEKIECRSPKSCLQEAFQFGLLADNPLWLQMLEDRNLTSHAYDDALAKRIYGDLKPYAALLSELQNALTK